MKTVDVPLEENRNVTWFASKGAWVAYISIIIVLRIFVSFVFGVSTPAAWTITNLVHAMGTWMAFHLSKGLPFTGSDQGKYAKLTMWEQLDQGVQFSPTKKLLTVVPIVLFLVTTHYTSYNFLVLTINLVALIVLLVSKLPRMHKVRLFGVNSGPS
jgi:hypothetical protein